MMNIYIVVVGVLRNAQAFTDSLHQLPLNYP